MRVPDELAEAMAVDLGRKMTLAEWNATDAEQHGELVAAWNAYTGEAARLRKAGEAAGQTKTG